MSAAVAKLQALADQAAAEEAEVIRQAQPPVDLANAILRVYRLRGVADDKAFALTLRLVPFILAVGDRAT